MAAVKQVLDKLDSSANCCRLLATRPLDELMATMEQADHIEKDAFGELPLFYATNRGARLELLAYEVAQLLRPATAFADKTTGRLERSSHVIGLRVAVKSSARAPSFHGTDRKSVV